MKLNFWQILGLILMVLALIAILYRELVTDKKAPPAGQPTTLPTPA